MNGLEEGLGGGSGFNVNTSVWEKKTCTQEFSLNDW